MVGQGAVVKAAIREINSPGHATGADFGCKDSQPGFLGGGRGHDLVRVYYCMIAASWGRSSRPCIRWARSDRSVDGVAMQKAKCRSNVEELGILQELREGT